ncbi:MAG: tetratricopeptide repeat protein [Proteobacteria bacterium]|nr:tetratricopeptide repeat protein [Pseudomonadota bacterium]
MSLIHQALKKLDNNDGPRKTTAAPKGPVESGTKRKKVLLVLMLASILFLAVVYILKYTGTTGPAESGIALPKTVAQPGRAAEKKTVVQVADKSFSDKSSAGTVKAVSTETNKSAPSAATGVELYKAAKYDKAIEVFIVALTNSPDDPVLNNNIGLAYFSADKRDEAKKHFTAALATEPRYAEAINNYGAVVASEGKSREAIGLYKRAIAIDHDLASAHFNIAVEYERVGKYTEARRAYEEYLKLGKNRDYGKVVKRIEELKAAE